jgi:hypothetical protein
VTFVREGELFEDEEFVLDVACKELMVTPEKLLGFEVMEGVSLRDLLRVRRAFEFIRLIVSQCLKPLVHSRPEIVFPSLLPFFRLDQLELLLKPIVPDVPLEKILSILTWDPASG